MLGKQGRGAREAMALPGIVCGSVGRQGEAGRDEARRGPLCWCEAGGCSWLCWRPSVFWFVCCVCV